MIPFRMVLPVATHARWHTVKLDVQGLQAVCETFVLTTVIDSSTLRILVGLCYGPFDACEIVVVMVDARRSSQFSLAYKCSAISFATALSYFLVTIVAFGRASFT